MASSSSPETLSAQRKKAIQELIRGRDLANQLIRVIIGANPCRGDDDGSLTADDIVTKILASFTQTISIFNCSATDQVTQILADGRKFDDSSESRKASVVKDRRGYYKKSRKASETWTRLTSTLIDDGHAWRKYGQKVILNAKHPRNYYRCTHKFDQGCQATKQVQKTEEDPPMYWITYHAHHTCKNPIQYPDQILLDSAPAEDFSSIQLNFGSNHPNNNSSHDSFLPTLFPWIKQEYKEDNTKQISFNLKQSPPPLPPYDYLLSPNLTVLESSGPITMSPSGSDHGDVISSGVYSCTASTTNSQSLDVELDDMMVGAVDFDDFEFLN